MSSAPNTTNPVVVRRTTTTEQEDAVAVESSPLEIAGWVVFGVAVVLIAVGLGLMYTRPKHNGQKHHSGMMEDRIDVLRRRLTNAGTA